MDKKTVQNLIEDTFNDSFSEEKFIRFSQELLNDIDFSHSRNWSTLIYEDFSYKISKYKRVGLYTDPNGNEIEVLIIEVEKAQMLERARTSLRNFVIKWLQSDKNKSKSRDYGLVAFYAKDDNGIDWRFSFIKVEQTSFMDEERGKVKTKKEFTPAKRYSFLVGKYEKAHTAKNQLLPLLQNISNNPTIEELEAAFSIEKVTDEFFNQYKDLYIKLYEHFENDVNVKSAIDQAGIDNARFTKKLLGQIVFLYFLQKKGWLGVAQNARWGTGKKRFVQELNEQAQAEGVNFFKDKLQYLFYEALAKERDNVNSYYERFDCRIPFLNGGLFEADYMWQEANITIPDKLFHNEEKNKAGDVGTGILDVFDRYNFTIKEDEPLDKEVAVDPEMLGKVFENMLDITERKSKGAFYTPREIVHYMCQESLIHYLDNALNSGTSSYQELGSDQTKLFGGSTNKKGNLKIELEHTDNIHVPKKDIETFIREGHFALENDERVAAKGETKTYQYQLPENIRKNADLIDQKLSSIKICDPAIGSGAFPVGLLHELVNAMLVLKPHLSYDYLTEKLKGFGFTHRESISDSRYIYRLKRHIIQESIYGVDIDSSAIDIARLRLWLSLVVDEDDLDPIETLPNLDYKIVCGNSLIGFPEGWNSPAFEKIENLKREFYNETDEIKKKDLKASIESEIQDRLKTSKRVFGYHVDFDFKLFFSEVWREKGGFDVVIGNPPYLNLTKNNFEVNHLKIFDENFTVLRKAQSKNLFALFIELGIKLLNQSATISMIVPEGLAQTRSYTDVRKLFSKNSVDKILTFKNFVFSQAVIGNVVFFTTPKSSDVTVLNFINESEQTVRNVFSQNEIKSNPDFIWVLNKPHQVLQKLENNSKLLKDLNYSFSKGMVVQNRNEFLRTSPKSDDLPFILGKDLSRFYLRHTNYANYNELTIVGGTKKLDKHLITPRILIRRTGAEICAAYSANKELIESTCYIMTGNDLKLLAGILNSSPINYYLKSKFITNQQGYPQILLNDLILLPIKLPIEIRKFEIIIDYLIFLGQLVRSDSIEYLLFYSIIDGLSYEAYFPEEIKSAGKEILKHLGDLKPITDDMSEEKKLAIIQSEFERLYDPNHPVRFAIETLDSVEEVRIIKEALK